MLGDIPAMLAALNEASEHALAAGRKTLADDCRIFEIGFWLRQHGNPAKAREVQSRRSRSFASDLPGRNAAGIINGLIDLEWRLSGHQPADAAITALLDATRKEAACHVRLTVTATLLSVLSGNGLQSYAEELVELLIAGFERLPDAIARSVYPLILREQRSACQLGERLRRRLVELVLLPEQPTSMLGIQASPSDHAWAGIAHAHLLRCIGCHAEARLLTERAAGYFNSVQSLTGLREIWYLQALLNAVRIPAAAVPNVLARFDGEPAALRDMIAIEQAELASRIGARDTARAWMGYVDLQRLRGWPSHYRPRALLTTAMLSRDAATKQNLFTEAEACYRELEDQRGVDFCRKLLGQINIFQPPSNSQVVWSANHYQKVLITRQAVETFYANLELKAAWENETVPWMLVKALSESPERLADWGFDTLMAIGAPGDRVIETDHLGPAALPWEFARFGPKEKMSSELLYRGVQNERYPVQWLQQGLRILGFEPGPVDGIVGPRTQEAYRQLRQQLGQEALNPHDRKQVIRERLAQIQQGSDAPGKQRLAKFRQRPRAVILQASVDSQQASRRGLWFSGSPLAKVYEDCGFECRIFQGEDMDSVLIDEGKRHPPDLVHIYAPYAESRSSGDVGPDFGCKLQAHKPRAGAFVTVPIPLLILDGPGEPEPAERMRQIMLRNASGTLFAQRLDCPNVLAFGLASEPNLLLLRQVLEGLRRGNSLRMIYHGLTKNNPEIGFEDLKFLLGSNGPNGSLAAALWTADPDLSVPLGWYREQS